MSGLFSIRNKLLGAFLVIAVFSVGVTYLNIRNQATRSRGESLIVRDYTLAEALLEMKSVASDVGREAITFNSSDDSAIKKNELLANLERLDKWEGEYKKYADVKSPEDLSFISKLENTRNTIVDAALAYSSMKERGISGIPIEQREQSLETAIAELKDVIENAIVRERADTRTVSESALQLNGMAAKENITLSSIAVIIALAFGFLLNRLIARPIRRLRDGATRIASGDLTQHVSADTNDEIGQLANAFNVMSIKLKESHDGLEAQVHQTEEKADALERGMNELERLNNLMVDRELKMIELKKEIELLKAQHGGPVG
jgi:methyl-accepting chemotaxis protein